MWPPRSPDLNPCDFFLWGFLKETVYSPLPKTINELKANIMQDCEKLNSKILKPVFTNIKKRCELVLSADGGQIEINLTNKISFFSSFRKYIVNIKIESNFEVL